MTEQKLKIKDFNHWPFPVVFGVSVDGKKHELSRLYDISAQQQSKCIIKWTKEPKCKLCDTFEDLGEPLF